MSGDLTRDTRKPWLNIRVEDCKVDGTLSTSGDIVTTGDIVANSILLTGNADQDILDRNKSDVYSITYTGDVLPGGSQVRDARFSRTGDAVTCELEALTFNDTGAGDSSIVADLSGIADFAANYSPANHVFNIVPIKDENLNNVNAHENLQLGMVSLDGTDLELYAGIPGGNFTKPGAGQTGGWQRSIVFSYTA